MGAGYLEHPLGRKLLERAGERCLLYLPLVNNLPGACLISELACDFFFYVFFFCLAAENILIPLTKESGAYSDLVKIH